MGLEDDLTAYYTAEALAGARHDVGELRLRLRERFARTLHDEGRSSLTDVGAGPGLDAAAFTRDGFAVMGVDLVPANVQLMRRRGLTAVAASIYDLPFRIAAFDALWTMSTFVHVPDARVDCAIEELVRVAAPGAPLAIGTWGGHDFEGVPEFGEFRPYRFFALRSHDRWHEMLARHGAVETFETVRPNPAQDWEYQFAVVRAPV